VEFLFLSLFGQCSTRVANELGAGCGQPAKQAVATVVSLSALQAIIISSTLLLLRHKWGWLFSSDEEVVNAVAGIMPFLACIALLDGIQGVLSGTSHNHSRVVL
jgi:MATE family multidrug resistance protein